MRQPALTASTRVVSGTRKDDAEDGLMRERRSPVRKDHVFHGSCQFHARFAGPGMGLNSSLSMADDIIGQATATRDMLMNQRNAGCPATTSMRLRTCARVILP